MRRNLVVFVALLIVVVVLFCKFFFTANKNNPVVAPVSTKTVEVLLRSRYFPDPAMPSCAYEDRVRREEPVVLDEVEKVGGRYVSRVRLGTGFIIEGVVFLFAGNYECGGEPDVLILASKRSGVEIRFGGAMYPGSIPPYSYRRLHFGLYLSRGREGVFWKEYYSLKGT